MKLNFVFLFIGLALCSIFFESCAYQLSNKVDHLPENYHSVYVPIFENKSTEPNVEVIFTDSLKNEVMRFGKINLTSYKYNAEGTLSGVVNKIEVTSDESVIQSKDALFLPYGTVLPTQVKVTITATITFTDNKTNKILWSSEYKQSKNYTPPQVTLPVLNSANNTYNLSERRLTISALSKEMMQLAFDRLVDNF